MASIYRLKNSKNWYYCITYNGIKYQGSTKTTDRQSAKLIAEAMQTDIAREENKIPVLKKKSIGNFPILWEEYLKAQAVPDVRKRTASNHFFAVFENKRLNRIAMPDIRSYQLERKLELMSLEKNEGKREAEINFRSVNYEIAILRNFFNYCIEKKYIDKNPCEGVKKLNELSRLRTLSDEDIAKLVAGATNKLTRDIIMFLIYTGCRKGEALNLKWDDVDFDNGVVAIKATKTRHDRYVPVSAPLKGLLEGIANEVHRAEPKHSGVQPKSTSKEDGCSYVFNNGGKKIVDFKHSFKTACRNAGLKDLRIHDLRHVFASKMVMNGTSLYITGELLGHRTPNMTKRYSHLVPDTLRKAVNDVWGKKK